MKRILMLCLALGLLAGMVQPSPAISATTIQILHASDLEGGVEAIPHAP
jgi:hypothetical protein